MNTQKVKIALGNSWAEHGNNVDLHVEKLDDNLFRLQKNAHPEVLPLCKGTEFKTHSDQFGNHRIVKIVKKSENVSRQFLLSSDNYDEHFNYIAAKVKQVGGTCHPEFGGIINITMPQVFEYLPEQICAEKHIKLQELEYDDE